eukprot:TRINITY_DN3876_c0_g1_i1.p1 TRINITY_DN3876_c0_g1~~TRINITY_DN3876_c0_g1_i1.p1  ORF type:complete len:322 (+),score=66.43 TRINITY_DN3876_c0_g1_i1:108-1073(+)
MARQEWTVEAMVAEVNTLDGEEVIQNFQEGEKYWAKFGSSKRLMQGLQLEILNPSSDQDAPKTKQKKANQSDAVKKWKNCANLAEIDKLATTLTRSARVARMLCEDLPKEDRHFLPTSESVYTCLKLKTPRQNRLDIFYKAIEIVQREGGSITKKIMDTARTEIESQGKHKRHLRSTTQTEDGSDNDEEEHNGKPDMNSSVEYEDEDAASTPTKRHRLSDVSSPSKDDRPPPPAIVEASIISFDERKQTLRTEGMQAVVMLWDGLDKFYSEQMRLFQEENGQLRKELDTLAKEIERLRKENQEKAEKIARWEEMRDMINRM